MPHIHNFRILISGLIYTGVFNKLGYRLAFWSIVSLCFSFCCCCYRHELCALLVPNRHVLFGEWCRAKHRYIPIWWVFKINFKLVWVFACLISNFFVYEFVFYSILYTALPDHFLAFDIYDNLERKFYSYERLKKILEETTLRVYIYFFYAAYFGF